MFGSEMQPSPVTIVGRRGPRAAVNLQSECRTQHDAQIEMCNAIAFHRGGARGIALCKQQVFLDYQECRGY
jgi:hypothetical protein